ncbi:MAG: SAF domain-containing protein [Mobilitalea sp.]
MRRKLKRTTKQYMIVAALCILVMGGAAMATSIIITGQVKDKYTLLLKDAYREMAENKRTIYIANQDIAAGEMITNQNVLIQTVYSQQPVNTFITEADIGKVSIIPIMTGTQLLSGMLTDKSVTSDQREMEYDVIHLNSNIVSNDTVDIRIIYPNGESYVVVSKKVIKGVQTESTSCYFWLSEDELLNMSAAIVDAGLYQGSRLITAKYVEPSIQKASIVTYTPSLQVMSLIESNPDIIELYTQELSEEVRKSLENRLAANMKVDVSAAAWDVSNYKFNDINGVGTVEEQPDIITSSVNPDAEEAGEDLGTVGNEQDQNRDEYMFYADEEEAREGDVEYGE